MEQEATEVERGETAIRVLYTLLFALVISVLETVVGALVVFQLLFALITKQEPGERVTEFANRVCAYFYRVLRYLTYNDGQPPFPFDDFPQALEPRDLAPEPDAAPEA